MWLTGNKGINNIFDGLENPLYRLQSSFLSLLYSWWPREDNPSLHQFLNLNEFFDTHTNVHKNRFVGGLFLNTCGIYWIPSFCLLVPKNCFSYDSVKVSCILKDEIAREEKNHSHDPPFYTGTLNFYRMHVIQNMYLRRLLLLYTI